MTFAAGNSRFLYGDDERLVAWAQERILHNRFRDDARAIGHEIDGELAAVVVFDTFGASNCFVSLAAGRRKWFSKEFAIVAMSFPFVQCRFSRISCLVSTENRLSLRFTKLFGGWKQEGLLREAGPNGEDMALFGMLARDCRALRGMVLPLSLQPTPALAPVDIRHCLSANAEH